MSEFTDNIKKVSEPRNHKIKGSFGVYDAYKSIRKLNWLNIGRPLLEHEFYTIIRLVNKEILQLLSIGKKVNLPLRMGYLEVRKVPKYIKFKEGKLITNRTINWKKTLDLWELDLYCFANKVLVRNENSTAYFVAWIKGNSTVFKNRSFFLFNINRKLKKLVISNILNGVIKDAYNLYRKLN